MAEQCQWQGGSSAEDEKRLRWMTNQIYSICWLICRSGNAAASPATPLHLRIRH
ncbi:unnamed protein product, partial [Brassica rapa]